MRRRERQRGVQIAPQIVRPLTGQRVHQVDVEAVVVPGGDLDRPPRLVAVMDTADRRQQAVVEALHADRQPVHPGRRIVAEPLRLEGPGVRLHRDLGLRHQRQPGAHHRQQRIDRRRREQAGGAAADEHRVHRPAPDLRQRCLQIGLQRRQILPLGVGECRVGSARNRRAASRRAAAPLVGIEVAVRALPQAPRQMQVQRQRRQAAQAAVETDGDRGGAGGDRDDGHDRAIHTAIVPRALTEPPSALRAAGL